MFSSFSKFFLWFYLDKNSITLEISMNYANFITVACRTYQSDQIHLCAIAKYAGKHPDRSTLNQFCKYFPLSAVLILINIPKMALKHQNQTISNQRKKKKDHSTQIRIKRNRKINFADKMFSYFYFFFSIWICLVLLYSK